MPNSTLSTKRLMIDKANARIVVYVSVAVFILIFSLVATKTLIGQAAYQNRVIDAKREANDQLKDNIAAADKLKTSYTAWNGANQNVIGGNSNALGPRDGDNAKIILDALPSTYDFPGLTTSLEALMGGLPVVITGITGTDEEVAQSANKTSSTPQALAMPFTMAMTGDYAGTQSAVTAFEKSIRPMQLQTLDIGGANGKLTLNVTAQTYYQPGKSLNQSKKVVK